MNNQPVEGMETSDSVMVNSIWKTIQGEGPFAGEPAVFIRLAGCNLKCPLCDTEYTKRIDYRPEDVMAEVDKLTSMGRKPPGLVVISGGEPFRQHALDKLVGYLCTCYKVQIETNGTVFWTFSPFNKCTIVCSPKTTKIHPAIRRLVEENGAFKYVVSHGCVDPGDGLPLRVLGKKCKVFRPPVGFPKDRIFVQPADEKEETANLAHRKQAIDVCMKYGYRFCLQVHKMIGLQ